MPAVQVGPERGTLILRTSRQGFAAQAGHDLVIEVTRWSGAVSVAEDPAASTVEIVAELGTLRVLRGTGGALPLSDRDKREIASTARRLLGADHSPRARFTSNKISVTDKGGVVEGILTLRGQDRPLRLTVTELDDKRYRATGRVVQSEYGITPYTAFLGALRLADPVEVEAEIDVSEPAS